PGNVRELENLIERGVILASQHGRIEAEQLFVGRLPSENAGEGIGAEGNLGSPLEPPDDSLCEQVLSAGLSLDEVEEMLIRFAVRQADGNLAGAARTLGMTRAQLSYRLKKHLADDNQRDRA
ncbi:MAG: AAA family ATPase, partial [Rhodocyclaceae bacterium]|nr:AAA family ATPase [Rhodocyclaceae bacterium]